MLMLTRRSAVASMAAFVAALRGQGKDTRTALAATEAPILYQPTWPSLRRHRNPQWLSDAKLGIYTHWGPLRGSDLHDWRPDKFDPEGWADLIKSAGAKFAGPVSEHGAQVAMWDSNLTELTVVKQGPKRDVMGEMREALRKRGIRFLASFHAFGVDERRLARGGKVREVVDKYQPDVIYFDLGVGGSLGARNSGSYIGGKKLSGKDNVYTGEPESDRKEFLAYYFNQADKYGNEVQVFSKEYDFSPGVGMRDVEDGREPQLAFDEWVTDIDIASSESGDHGLASPWFYSESIKYKSPHSLICELVDATAKNGRILLNVGPKPDGSFSNEAIERLEAIGDWLKVNGEAIHGTSPWVIYGEGPTDLRSIDLFDYYFHGSHSMWDLLNLMKAGVVQYGHYSQIYVVPYKPEDVRFTIKGDSLFAICLGWPGKAATFQSLGSGALLKFGEISSIRMLGLDRDLGYTHTESALKIDTPPERPCEHAYTFKILRKLSK
jgi:alpha-L-fucosidase